MKLAFPSMSEAWWQAWPDAEAIAIPRSGS